MKIKFFSPLSPPTDHDWPEDFELENGNYINECIYCQIQFRGYKRRHVCRKCYFEGYCR